MSGVVSDLIEVSSLSKHYEARGVAVKALDDVNFSVRRGEFVSIVGPSGCGKSTLLYIMGGFLPPDGGRVDVWGRQVDGPGLDRGVVFQEYALFPWLSVADNIAYGLKQKSVPAAERAKLVRHYVALIGLQGFENRYPRELSGGMRQRVAIARTLACEPDILLLDEPLGALDALTREIMQDELLRIWKDTGKTVVMITHDVNEAVYLSQRVLVMSRRPGRIVDEFEVQVDRTKTREDIVLSDEFNAIRNRVWLSVRQQAFEPAPSLSTSPSTSVR
jgi:NitT/TauT family transport system ATP-binding protein